MEKSTTAFLEEIYSRLTELKDRINLLEGELAAYLAQQAEEEVPVPEDIPETEENNAPVEEVTAAIEEEAPAIEESEPLEEYIPAVEEEPEPAIDEAEPVVEEPEPIAEEAPAIEESAVDEPEPEPIIDEPEPEPVVEEPEPEPVVEEPEPAVEEVEKFEAMEIEDIPDINDLPEVEEAPIMEAPAEEDEAPIDLDIELPKPAMSINDAGTRKLTKSVGDAASEKPRWKTDRPGSPVRNIISAISLNDRVLFIKTLFNEEPMTFQQSLTELNNMSTIDEAESYIYEHFPEWKMNSDIVYRFMMAVRRKLG